MRSPDRTARFAAVAGGLGRQRGGSAWAISFVLGLSAAAALPPLSQPLAVFVAFPLLVWQIDGSPGWRAAAGLGWWFGLGHFLAGTFWISNALLVEPERFAWLIPLATLGLSSLLAVYPAAACGFARLLRPGLARIAGLACAWTAMEMLRGAILTGFPWNPIGSIWSDFPAMLQSAALFGVFGLGFCTVALAAAPALLAGPSHRARWSVLAVMPLVLAAAWIGGALRLSGAGEEIVPGVRLALVQPAIVQRDKVEGRLRLRNFIRHLDMSRARLARPGVAATHVVWPETAIQIPVAHAPAIVERLIPAVPAGGYLIAGAVRATPPDARPFRVWNSLQVFDPGGRVAAVYDKAHLVPFGEYVPLGGLAGLARIVGVGPGFTPGPGPRTLAVPGLPPFGSLICYEAIFPGAVVEPGRRPAWLLNLTNDGWFGESSGPYQHFAAARLRAVEEGLPVVRAANSGISGVIDAHGRVRARLGLGRRGVLDAELPAAPVRPTLFARVGNAPVALLLLATGALLGIRFRTRRRGVDGAGQSLSKR